MTIPAGIPETPMAQSNHESYQESQGGTTSPRSMEGFQHIINKVIHIQNQEEMQSIKQLMSYRGFKPSLTCVMLFLTCWKIFMNTVNAKWMV